MKSLVITAVFLGVALLASAQKATRQQEVQPAQTQQKRSQAVPLKTSGPFGAEAFKPSNNMTSRWLGYAGFFINSRGATLMVDPF